MQEKKTHSSSVGRRRCTRTPTPDYRVPTLPSNLQAASQTRHHEDDDIEEQEEPEHHSAERDAPASVSYGHDVRQEKVSPTVIDTPVKEETPAKSAEPQAAAPESPQPAEAVKGSRGTRNSEGGGGDTALDRGGFLKGRGLRLHPQIRNTFKDDNRPPFPARGAPRDA